MILGPFINLIFLSYWFAVHAEALDNHFTTVMMNIMKMVLLTDLQNWFCSFCCCCCRCFFCSTNMSDEGKFGNALNSTNEWEKNWIKNTTGQKMPFKWKRRESESKGEDRQQWDFMCVVCRSKALLYFPCFHVWLPFTIIDTPPNHHTTMHRSTYQIVYALECWGEIVSRRKYVNRSNSIAVWPDHSWNVYLHYISCCCECRSYAWVSVTVPCIFDFRFVSPKLASPQWFSILWFHFYALFVRFRSGSKFDQGLFIAHLLLKIDPEYAFFSLYPSISVSLYPPSWSVHVSFLISWPIYLSFVMNHYIVFWLAFLAIFKSGIEAKSNKMATEKNVNKRSRREPMVVCIQQQLIVKV